MTDVAPTIRQAMREVPSFEDAWQEGLASLRNKQHYAMPVWEPSEAFRNLPPLPKLGSPQQTLGHSELLAKR